MPKPKFNYANLLEVPMRGIIDVFTTSGFQVDGDSADLYNYEPLPFIAGNKIRRNLKYVRHKHFTKHLSDKTIIFAYIGGTIERGEVNLLSHFSLGHPLFTKLLKILQRAEGLRPISIVDPLDLYRESNLGDFHKDDVDEEVQLKAKRAANIITACLSPEVESQINIDYIFHQIDEVRKRNLNNTRRIHAKEIVSLLLQNNFDEAEFILNLVKADYLETAKFLFDDRTGKTIEECYQSCFTPRSETTDGLPNNHFIDGEFIEMALKMCKSHNIPNLALIDSPTK